jgi:flagellar motility protein MotE (MotC chaperone)
MLEILLTTLLLASEAVDGGQAPEAAPAAAPVAPAATPDAGPAEATKKDEAAQEKARDKEMGRRTGPVSPAALKEGVRRAREKPARGSDEEAAARQKKETEELVARLDAAREKMRLESERLEKLIKEYDRRRAEGCPAQGNNEEGSTEAEPAPAPKKKAQGGNPAPVQAPTARPMPPPPDVDALAKSLKSMKPKQAANVVERLDRTTAARALKKMSPRSAGGVLAAMSPNAAAEVADAMTMLRDTP